MAGSRLKRVEERRSLTQAIIYIILSTVLLLLIYKWGVPGFIKLLAWWTGVDRPTVQQTGLKIPPQTPALAPLPEATFSASIKISGMAQGYVKIKLYTNDQFKDETETDTDGNFEFSKVALLDGVNVIGVQAVNNEDKASDIAQTEVILDSEAPKLEIREPAEEAAFYGNAQKNVQIKGTMGEAGHLDVNGLYVDVSNSGTFDFRRTLASGMNEFTIVATDKAGNETTQLLRLTFQP